MRWLCAPESEVSCHYLVHEDGRIVDFTVMARPLSAAMALRDAIGPHYVSIVGTG